MDAWFLQFIQRIEMCFSRVGMTGSDPIPHHEDDKTWWVAEQESRFNKRVDANIIERPFDVHTELNNVNFIDESRIRVSHVWKSGCKGIIAIDRVSRKTVGIDWWGAEIPQLHCVNRQSQWNQLWRDCKTDIELFHNSQRSQWCSSISELNWLVKQTHKQIIPIVLRELSIISRAQREQKDTIHDFSLRQTICKSTNEVLCQWFHIYCWCDSVSMSFIFDRRCVTSSSPTSTDR
jgi:hypothetical protein